MEMLYYEIKKILKFKFFWIALGILLLLDGYKVYSLHNLENKELEGHQVIYNQIKGPITNDKISFVTKKYKEAMDIVNSGNFDTSQKQEGTYTGYILGDQAEFEFFYKKLKYAYYYSDAIHKIIQKAESNIVRYQTDNPFESRKNRKILNNYQGRCITSFYNMDNMEKYLDYDHSDGFILLLLVLVISYIFMGEKYTRMDNILRVTKYGEKHLVLVKIITASLLTLFLVVVFSITDIALYKFFYGIEGFTQPLYSIEAYQYTPYNKSIVEYVIWNMGMKFIGCYFIALIILGLSTILQDSIAIFVWSGISISLYIYLCISTQVIWNPILLLEMNHLVQSFQVVDVLHVPVYKHSVIVIYLIMNSMVFISLMLLLAHKKVAPTLQKSGLKRCFKKRKNYGYIKD